MTGKELVNSFYQPLGALGCQVSSDEMWTYAKSRALDVVQMLLAEHPMYVGNLNPRWKKWDDIRREIIALP